jgi:cardiolipin synthase A/B
MEATRRPPRTRHWLVRTLLGLFSLVGLLWLVACNSLPVIVPDQARDRGRPVQFEGARGPLSAAESKAVLDGLASRGPATDIFERHLALEEAVVGSPLTTGNQVLLLQDGPATFQAMYAAILAARDHINMGDLHPGRRRGWPALCTGPDRQATAGRPGRSDP